MSMSKNPNLLSNKMLSLNMKLLPSKTLQGAARDADINTIVSRFLKTGTVPPAIPPTAYGDLTTAPDLVTALNFKLQADKAWASLPPHIRGAVGDPAKLLDWLKDPDNFAVARKAGLIEVRPIPALQQVQPLAGAGPGPTAGSSPASSLQPPNAPPGASLGGSVTSGSSAK